MASFHLHEAFFKAPKMCFMQPKLTFIKEQLFIGQLIARSHGKNKFLMLSCSREGNVTLVGKSKTCGGINPQISAFNQERIAVEAGSHPASAIWGLKQHGARVTDRQEKRKGEKDEFTHAGKVASIM